MLRMRLLNSENVENPYYFKLLFNMHGFDRLRFGNVSKAYKVFRAVFTVNRKQALVSKYFIIRPSLNRKIKSAKY